jgi:hypothetical protein
VLVVSAVALAGCASPQYDPALARQVAAAKDDVMTALTDSTGTSREAFLEDVRSDSGPLPGRFWDGTADPAALGLAAGGIALYDLEEGADGAAFSVLIGSGPRDGTAEEDGDPASIYTCFRIEVAFEDDAVTVWRRQGSTSDEPAAYCAPDLVETLGEGAQVAPVVDFDG